MPTNIETRRANLRALIAEKFDTDSAFAEHIGRAPSYVSRLFSDGAEARTLGNALAEEIEMLCELPRGWLDADRSNSERGKVRLLAPASCAMLLRGELELEAIEHPVWLSVSDTVARRRNAFAVPVRDDLMQGNAAACIPNGADVVADLDAHPQPGEVVITVLQGELEPVVRVLRRDGERVYLVPSNTRYVPRQVAASSLGRMARVLYWQQAFV